MKIQGLYKPAWAFILGVGMIIATGCTQHAIPEPSSGMARMQPRIYTGDAETRSMVNGSGTGGADKISKVALYVTRNDTHVAYPGMTNNGCAEFTYDGTNWEGTVNLSDIVARIYAFSPSGSTVTPASGADTHTIPVKIDAEQTFNGANQWGCSVADYLYGTTTAAIEATPVAINASNKEGHYSPSIYLHHALAQVVFRLQTASGRPVDATYDYVKSITLKHTASSPFRTGTGTMRLKDGSLGGSLTASQSIQFKPIPASSAVKCGANTNPVVVAYGLVAPLASAPANNSLTITLLLGKPEAADNERELTVTIPTSPQWTKGKRYVYTLTLNDRAITVDGTTEITGWTPSNDFSDMNPDGF